MNKNIKDSIKLLALETAIDMCKSNITYKKENNIYYAYGYHIEDIKKVYNEIINIIKT